MLTQDQVKRKQLIRAAEGYLDLMSVFDDRWPLEQTSLETLAGRVIECLDQIENPQSFQSHIFLLKGQAMRVSGKLEAAARFFQQALDAEPENMNALLATAWCFKRMGQMARAIEAMRRAVEIDGESAIAHYNLACYLALEGQTKESCEHLAIALEIDPKYREHVRGESDFDAIRKTPEFQAALSINV